MKIRKAKKWKVFYELRDELLSLVNDNLILLEGERLNADDISEENWNNWERAIGYIEDIEIFKQLETTCEELKVLYYKLAKEECKINDLPQFFENIEQIDLSTSHNASSLRIDKSNSNEFFQLNYYPDEWVEENFDIFTKIIDDFSDKTDKMIFPLPDEFGINICILNKDLLEYFDAEHIQARYITGTTYYAKLREKGATKGIKVKYGIIVLNEKPSIIPASKQKKRSDAYREEDALKLPIPSPWLFYKKK